MRVRFLEMTVTAALLACSSAPQEESGAQAPASPQPAPARGTFTTEVVARNLEHAWGIAFLPDGRMLVTERAGRLRFVDRAGAVSAPVAGVPPVYARGQGGLLDVAVDPDFTANQFVYLAFAEPAGGLAGTSVARGRLAGGRLENVRVIYRQQPKKRGGGHYGSRLVFSRDGTLFVTQGDRQGWSREAQDLRSGLGKIVRINRDGTIPRDNPFIGRDDARPEIWSYGHRNVQAAVLDRSGRLLAIEHGPRGGDELNIAEAGKNYGWPVIGYGVDYSGRALHRTRTRTGMEQPVYYWDPVIAPSGMMIYDGAAFPEWKGSIFVGSLSPGALVRLVMDGGRITKEERYLAGERIRDVQQGPDGFIYVVTDEPRGRILRVRP